MGRKESIRIEIDPETLCYEAHFDYAFIDDIYVVLRLLARQIENGDLEGDYSLKDKDGKPLTKEDVIKYITRIKERIDSNFFEESPGELVRDFGN